MRERRSSQTKDKREHSSFGQPLLPFYIQESSARQPPQEKQETMQEKEKKKALES